MQSGEQDLRQKGKKSAEEQSSGAGLTWWQGSQEDFPEKGDGAGSGRRRRSLQGGRKGRLFKTEEENVQVREL